MLVRAHAALALVAVALAAGCVKSCDCGGKGPAAAGPSTGTAGGAAIPPRATANGPLPPTAGAPGTPGRALDRQVFTPAPDSKLTRALLAARDEIDKGHVYDKLAEPGAIGAVLRDQIGELRADGPVSAADREGSGTAIAVAARNYAAGKRTVRVKIIDTARAPEARRAVSERLAHIGNTAAGNQHGLFVRGYPAVVAGFESERASRATALIGDRYLVQIMVREAAHPEDAQQILEQLDWGKLAPKQGKPPAPKP